VSDFLKDAVIILVSCDLNLSMVISSEFKVLSTVT